MLPTLARGTSSAMPRSREPGNQPHPWPKSRKIRPTRPPALEIPTLQRRRIESPATDPHLAPPTIGPPAQDRPPLPPTHALPPPGSPPCPDDRSPPPSGIATLPRRQVPLSDPEPHLTPTEGALPARRSGIATSAGRPPCSGPPSRRDNNRTPCARSLPARDDKWHLPLSRRSDAASKTARSYQDCWRSQNGGSMSCHAEAGSRR